MIRNFKVMAGALVGSLLVAAFTASGASASTIKSQNYPVSIEGSQSTTHKFTAGSTSITCENVTFQGSALAASSAVTLHPTVSGCTAFGFVNVTITTTGCDIVVHSAAEVSSEKFDGTVDVVCESGKAITVVAGPCSVEFKAQEGLNTISFQNTAGGQLTVGANVSGIAYTVTKDGFLCPLAGTGNFTNGGYTGDTAVFGNNGTLSVVP